MLAFVFRRGYCVRWWAVTHCLREFMEDTEGRAQRQVVSLGCGFDSLYFRTRRQVEEEPGRTNFWEVDFPEVVQRKCRVIEGTPELRGMLSGVLEPGGVALLSQDYKLLGVDLSDISNLHAALETAGISWDVPTLLLAEVALCYMEAAQSSAVIGFAARSFPHSRLVLYEQFSPRDPFGRVMMSHFASLNSPLHSVEAYPELEDQERRFRQQGWQCCRLLDINQFCAMCVPDEEVRRVSALEPFDEYEEFHLKCSHYFILAASRGILAVSPALRPPHMAPADGRLRHSLTPLGDGKVLVLGGRYSPSRPAGGAQILQYKDDAVTLTTARTDANPGLQRWRHTATMVTLSGKRYVLVFGGVSAAAALQDDWFFIEPEELQRVQVPVCGDPPPPCHTHSACSWGGGAVISGGLLISGPPSSSIYILTPQKSHFLWKKLETTPPLTPRFSHTSHVIGGKLLLVGGVWIHSRGIPGLTLVDLVSGHVSEYRLHTESLDWPLMLHSHSSVVLEDGGAVLLLGGGGTCFSFGTHMNLQPVLMDVAPLLRGRGHDTDL
ncbi:tRNA wybutosine-synthesizing protein 4 [Gastrophryne carolinensis]